MSARSPHIATRLAATRLAVPPRTVPWMLAIAAGWLVAGPLAAAERNAPTLAGDWPMETVVRDDGRVFRGLIDSAENGWLRMVHVARPPGRPMHLVILPVERSRIARIERVSSEQREELRRRIDHFRRRASIEAGREAAIELRNVQRWGQPMKAHRNRWFTLVGTINPEVLRHVAVRTDQLFTALRQLLPPRNRSAEGPTLVVLRSSDEYRDVLARFDLVLDNPACYLRSENLVVLRSDLAGQETALIEIRRRHDRLQQQLDALQKSIAQQLDARRRQLQQQGYSRGTIRRLLLREQHHLEEPLAERREKLEQFERENRRAMDAVADQLLERLSHESLHAYIDAYVYPADRWRLPTWLAEGLATMFETAQLDGHTLRVDAPNPAALKTLQADLRSDDPVSVAEVIRSPADAFLGNDDTTVSTGRRYAAAWGLVYYLAIDRALLEPDRLDRYLSTDNTSPPIERFERLTGEPLNRFEPRWRAAMLRLR